MNTIQFKTNIKCTGCKIDKELTEFSLTHIIPYDIIKANI
mgnify:CR=1 FL=1